MGKHHAYQLNLRSSFQFSPLRFTATCLSPDDDKICLCSLVILTKPIVIVCFCFCYFLRGMHLLENQNYTEKQRGRYLWAGSSTPQTVLTSMAGRSQQPGASEFFTWAQGTGSELEHLTWMEAFSWNVGISADGVALYITRQAQTSYFVFLLTIQSLWKWYSLPILRLATILIQFSIHIQTTHTHTHTH